MKRTMLVVLGLSVGATAALADVKLVVPYSAGGPTDMIARMIAPSLQQTLGETVIVENRPGASGMIGMTSVARSPADGKTLVVGTQGQVLTQLIQKKVVTYDAVKDFASVAVAGEVPSVLVVNNNLPINSLADLAALAKTKSLHYASSGVGNSPHLAGEMINKSLGIKMGHVPYAGAAPAIVDVIAGNVSMFVGDLPAVIEPIRAGQVKAVVVLAPERAAALPNVPCSAEQGYPKLFTGGYYYVAAPAKIDPALRKKLEDAVMIAVQKPDVARKFETSGVGKPGNGAAMDKILVDEFAKWTPLVDELGIVVK